MLNVTYSVLCLDGWRWWQEILAIYNYWNAWLYCTKYPCASDNNLTDVWTNRHTSCFVYRQLRSFNNYNKSKYSNINHSVCMWATCGYYSLLEWTSYPRMDRWQSLESVVHEFSFLANIQVNSAWCLSIWAGVVLESLIVCINNSYIIITSPDWLMRWSNRDRYT